MKRALLSVWFLSSLLLLAGGKKDERLVIQFNLEGDASDGPKMGVGQDVAGKQIVFRVSPEIATKDVESFRPFPSEDGITYGLLLKMNRAGRQRLAATTTANTGKMLLARLNGRTLDVVKIDKPINDGQLVIWQGVTAREIALMDSKMPRIGESAEEWKKRKK